MFNLLKKNKENRGVTLMELLVVISIVAILSAVLIVGNNKYRSSTATQNLADDIALSIRKAQGYAIGVHGDTKGDPNSFLKGYGVHFSTSTTIDNPSAGSQKAFVIFRDVSGDGKYTKDSSTTCGTPTAVNECMEVLKITNAAKISTVTTDVSSSGNTLDIVFKRPNPEPDFCYYSNSGSCLGTGTSSVVVKVGDGYGVYKTVTNQKNGLISVGTYDSKSGK